MTTPAMIGPKFYGFDANGAPLAGGKLYTYQAGTTTDKATFTTENGDVENTNPVILNSSGYASVHLDGSYAVKLTDADDNEIWTADPVSSNVNTEWIDCLDATYISSTSFSLLGDVTETYDVGRRIQIDNNIATYSYTNVLSSSFGGGITTVTTFDAVVAVGIISVCRSIISKDTLDSLQSTTYEVADITARDNLTPTNGDVAVVADDGDGKSATYKYNGSAWVLLSQELTNAEIKTQYEANTDTNAYTDADEAKLDSGAGYMPLTLATKTIDYIVLAADIGTRLTMDAATAKTITLDLALMPTSISQISFVNKGDGLLTVEVSNTGSMTFNNSSATTITVANGDSILTINGDTATNANSISALQSGTRQSTLLETYDMTNGGLDNINEIDITWLAAWDAYDSIKAVITNAESSSDGQMGWALSSDAGTTWEILLGTSKEAIGWSVDSVGLGDVFSGQMDMALNSHSKVPMCSIFSTSNKQISASGAFNQGYSATYSGTTLGTVGSSGHFNGWDTGSNGLDTYMLRFLHEVGNFTSGELKLYGINF